MFSRRLSELSGGALQNQSQSLIPELLNPRGDWGALASWNVGVLAKALNLPHIHGASTNAPGRALMGLALPHGWAGAMGEPSKVMEAQRSPCNWLQAGVSATARATEKKSKSQLPEPARAEGQQTAWQA